MIELKELFTPVYGVNLEFNKMIEAEDGVPFVGRTSKNNGIVGLVEEIEGVPPNPAMTISLSASGSVMESFLQEQEYYSGRDLYYLIPKVSLSKNQLLYYCMVLRANKYRYNYGRQANKTLAYIKIPSPEEIPNYVHAININEPNKTSVSDKQSSLENRTWKWFYLKEYFDCDRGSRLIKENRVFGKTPLVTAGENNLGVSEYISNEEQKIYKNNITVDMFCNSYYHQQEFCCDDNILAISRKDMIDLNPYVGCFIATVINMDKFKFQYGRQYRQKNFNLHKIKLPADDDGEPDWRFMEDYIKSLPYSSNMVA